MDADESRWTRVEVFIRNFIHRRPQPSTAFALPTLPKRTFGEEEERARVAVAGIVLILHDLLDRPARIDAECLQLDLNNRHTVDEQENIVPVVAVIGVNARRDATMEFERRARALRRRLVAN